jgi:hypothetical protein
MRQLSHRLLGWWYLAIAVGFVLLAVRSGLLGDLHWRVALRAAIAAGFAVLSWVEFRQRPR